jgi:hypothetical protein
MKRIWFSPLIFAVLIVLFSYWTFFASPSTLALAQQPTNIPAPQGMYITVLSDEPFANIRMGPSSTIYPKVGILYPGDTAPALGRSPGGDWIQIEYPGAPYNKGWVYSPLVQVSPGILQIVEPPPTPVPPPTATIDPTLAAQFLVIPTSTRMPTFTPPPSLAVPAYLATPAPSPSDSVSLAVIILAFITLGLIGFLLSLVPRR